MLADGVGTIGDIAPIPDDFRVDGIEQQKNAAVIYFMITASIFGSISQIPSPDHCDIYKTMAELHKLQRFI
jgi:hypothetical protein